MKCIHPRTVSYPSITRNYSPPSEGRVLITFLVQPLDHHPLFTLLPVSPGPGPCSPILRNSWVASQGFSSVAGVLGRLVLLRMVVQPSFNPGNIEIFVWNISENTEVIAQFI